MKHTIQGYFSAASGVNFVYPNSDLVCRNDNAALKNFFSSYPQAGGGGGGGEG